jgi:endonuclease-3 related protein
MLAQALPALRTELLALKGVGPETADSMILYAAAQPIFVVDAYTRRIFSRMGLVAADVGYDELRTFFHCHVPPDVEHYGDFTHRSCMSARNFAVKPSRAARRARCG